MTVSGPGPIGIVRPLPAGIGGFTFDAKVVPNAGSVISAPDGENTSNATRLSSLSVSVHVTETTPPGRMSPLITPEPVNTA